MATNTTLRAKVPPIINTHVVPAKDNRTLVVYRNQDITNSKWSCWDGLVTSVSDAFKWHEKVNLVALVLNELSVADFNRLVASVPNVSNLFVTEAVFTQFPREQWAATKISITIVDKMNNDFPIIGSPCVLTSSQDIAACVAPLFHYTHLVDCDSLSESRTAHLTELSIRLSQGIQPPAIWFITQYFVHPVTKRAREIRQCLKNNLLCPLIDKVVLLNETDLKYEWSSMRFCEKVDQRIIGHRLTYADLLRHTLEHVPDNTIVLYANADIYCNASIKEIYEVDMKDKLFALLRWDEKSGPQDLKLFGPRPDSQDTWILHSESVKSRTWDLSKFEYKLGTAGCDNRFTGDIFGMRFLVSNPCNSIQTVHIHNTEIRNYNKTDIVPAKLYLYVHPCSLMGIEQVPPSKSVSGSQLAKASASIQIQCPVEKRAITYCTMLARENRFTWTHSSPNLFNRNAIPVQRWTNAFLMNCGVVHDYKKIYYGANTYMDSFIAQTQSTLPFTVSFCKKTDRVDSALAIPIFKGAAMMTHPDVYCVYYLAMAIQLYGLLGKDTVPASVPGLFIYPPNLTTLQAFSFNVSADFSGKQIPAIQWDRENPVYAKELVGFVPMNMEVCKEDIGALRNAWSEWIPVGTNKCVVLIDEILTPEFAETSVLPLLPEGWTCECVLRSASGIDAYKKVAGASLCILYNLPKQDEQWLKLWALPKGCSTIEFQNELKVEGGFQHFAGACEFNSWIMPLHKGPPSDMRTQALEQLGTWLKEHLIARA